MGHNVLIVDDIAFNRTLMRAALRDMENVEFIEAVNGTQALEIMERKECHLVILDLMMPEKNGFEVLTEMRMNNRLRDIPVIVYSAKDDVDYISQALELGAYDYFTKPIKPKQMNVILPMKVKNALNSYEQQKTIQGFNEKMRLDLLLANVFQQSLLKEKQDFPLVTMYGKYVPSQEIGGDFFECVQMGDEVWFIMADVSGYGVSAAMLSSMLKMEFQHAIQLLSMPDKILQHMNNVFCKITQGNYCLTAFVGLIRSRQLWYSNAGQPYPLIYKEQTQTVDILSESSFTLGMIEDEQYGLYQIELEAGDVLMTYTDGLLEYKVASDSIRIYDDLANCFSSYKEIVRENPSEFFEILFRLFGNAVNKKVNNDMAVMLIYVK